MPLIASLTLSIQSADPVDAADALERIAALTKAYRADLAAEGVTSRLMPARDTSKQSAEDLALLGVVQHLTAFVGPISPATLWQLASDDAQATLAVSKASGRAYAPPALWRETFGLYWPAQPQQALDRLERGGLVQRLGRGQPPVWPGVPRRRGAWGVLYAVTEEGRAAGAEVWQEGRGLPDAIIRQVEALAEAMHPYRDKSGALCPVVAANMPERSNPARRVGRSGRSAARAAARPAPAEW